MECDRSSEIRKIDLEEIRTHSPLFVTQDSFIPISAATPHIVIVPLTKNIEPLNTGTTPIVTESGGAPVANEREVEESGTNEEPLPNDQDMEPQQPQEVNEEPQPSRRSTRVRKNAISDDYVVYMSEDVGMVDDPTSYKQAMMSENSQNGMILWRMNCGL